jgi:acyl carrier protein
MSKPDLEGVVEVIGEFVDLSRVQVTEQAVLGEDIPMDSREMLRVVSRLEAVYSARFSPQDVLGAKTLGQLLEVTRRRAHMA